jgi:hypothetical protein
MSTCKWLNKADAIPLIEIRKKILDNKPMNYIPEYWKSYNLTPEITVGEAVEKTGLTIFELFLEIDYNPELVLLKFGIELANGNECAYTADIASSRVNLKKLNALVTEATEK